MKSIDSKELIMAMEELEKERGISKAYLLESLETALVTAYKRNFDSAENVKVIIDDETGDIQIFAQKEVVEEVFDPMLEISLEDAKKYDKKTEIGNVINIEIFPKDFGRIAAQIAKQVVLQKLREVEQENAMSELSEKQNELVTGLIKRIENKRKRTYK